MTLRTYVNGPDKAEVIALRLRVQDALGLTQREAMVRLAGLTCSTFSAWRQWEDGRRRMHPGLWQLVQLRTNTHPLWALTANPYRRDPAVDSPLPSPQRRPT